MTGGPGRVLDVVMVGAVVDVAAGAGAPTGTVTVVCVVTGTLGGADAIETSGAPRTAPAPAPARSMPPRRGTPSRGTHDAPINPAVTRVR